MGLVSTWLNGIGLSNAVPTFQAAGIVTPAALAELDVAHFEALGISDPDDRRKLFYLVQRIKMAVNKDKKEEHSVVEQIDAVLSGTVPAIAEDEKKEERPAAATVGSPPETGKRGNSMKQNAVELRRSRRLANKGDATTGAKENLSVQTCSDKAPHSTAKSQPESTTKRTTRFRSQPKEIPSPERPVREQRRLESPKARVEKREEDAEGNNVTPKDEAESTDQMSTPRVTRGAVKKLGNESSRRASAVFNLDDESEGDEESSQNAHATHTNTSNGISGSRPAENRKKSKLQTPESKSQKAKVRRAETKNHQNLGISMRTGKRLSVIPSNNVAPMSPLDGVLPESLEITDGMHKGQVRTVQNNPRYRSSGSKQLSEELDGENSDYESSISNSSRSSRRRPKSIGVVEKVTTRPLRLSTSQSDVTASDTGRRKSVDQVKYLHHSHSETSTRGSRKVVPFVQGGTQSESWETKVELLREDNDSEYELFRNQEDQTLYEYDMRIRVIVRKRPVSKAEATMSGGVDVIHPLDYGDYGKILVYQPRTRVDLTKEIETIPFAYDNVYDESSTNIQIYKRSLKNLIHPFFRGQWSTVFAYGQTGSGKTYTMMGSNMTGINAGTAKHDEANLGLYYLAALDIFDMVKRPEYKHLTVQVSLFEIYGGKLFDLLNARKQVKCLEDSRGKVCFPGLTEHPVGGPDDLMELIEEGARNRSTGTTSRNADSSRSHAVLQLKLCKDAGRKKNIEHGRLNFIDLAGSERGADTSSASRATRLEGAEINTSLLALKEVIRALATGGSMTHIPFRGSKLTQVLKDSFVGKNSRCCMIACVSPDIGNCEQTLNTLRYADRVKERDADSGALANQYEQPTRLQKLDLSTRVIDNEDDPDEEADESCEVSSNERDEELEYDDGAFSTNRKSFDGIFHRKSDLSHDDQSSLRMTAAKQEAGEALVAAHRSVMSTMLSMVKDEMILVNEVDADRDGLDDYLVKLESLQNTHLRLISKLRGSLNNYVAVCEGTADENIGADASDEESFEDLRD